MELGVEQPPKQSAYCITTYLLSKLCLSVRWVYSSLYKHYLPQLLLSWEVHCENCGIPTMRVRGGTGLRWSLITLALLSATVSTHRGLVRDKWFTDQQTKTIGEKYKHWRGERSALKQAEGDRPESSLILWGRIWKVGGPEGSWGWWAQIDPPLNCEKREETEGWREGGKWEGVSKGVWKKETGWTFWQGCLVMKTKVL